MSLSLQKKSQMNENQMVFRSREEIEARQIMNEIFEHNIDRGALTTLTLGMPGSCKTALDCVLADYAMNNYPHDKIFWRSALNAPLQFFKLKKWHIFLEEKSTVRFIETNTQKDITQQLIEKKQLTVFKTFNQLHSICKPGVINAIFFKETYLKDIENDQGTLQWFKFFRYLLTQPGWAHMFFDEYHEMVKAGAKGNMWHEIEQHSNDISNARKCGKCVHGNAHQTQELDHRIISNIMVFIQMYGARKYKHNMVNKKALGAIPKPRENMGAYAWISTGGRFGKLTVKEVYKLPRGMNIQARIVNTNENTGICVVCGKLFEKNRQDKKYCSRACADHTHYINVKRPRYIEGKQNLEVG